MTIGVQIMPREVILDTQGRAIEQILKRNGQEVSSCRVGRFVELDFSGQSSITEAEALKKADEMARFVLHNPLIETYEIRRLPA